MVTPKISIWNQKHLDNIEATSKAIEDIGIKMIYTNHHLRCLSPTRYALPRSKVFWFFGGLLRVLARKLGIQNWVGWVSSALHSCRKLKSTDVDVILATGAPFWGFEIANRLSKRLGCPFVMDYRDLWTDNPWSPVRRKWVTDQEKRLLKASAAITIVSPISGEVLAKRYDLPDKIFTITNGFNKSELQDITKKQFDHFSIIFCGSLISAKMSLVSLFRALQVLNSNCNNDQNWKFHYFGPNTDVVKKEIKEWGLEDKSEIHGNLPRVEVLSFQKGASINVVLSASADAVTIEDKGVIPGKIFELIGMRASILPIVPKQSAVEAVLMELGVKCFSHGETEEIAAHIGEVMNGKKLEPNNIEKYSWEELAIKFDRLLRNFISSEIILK